MSLLIVAAVLPVFVLCFFVYKKDPHHEPGNLLVKIFTLGFFSAIPVFVVEIFLGKVFPTKEVSNFILIFINTFISVALVEEGFKWIVTTFIGYKGKEFDEIYDIIVYATFASLGFACIENILYVISHGFLNALLRALTSIPGHACFGIIMGYFLAQAKIGTINKNVKIFQKNILLSLFIPTIFHTLYDAFLLYTSYNLLGILLFFVFDIFMVVLCFITINKMSKIQYNLDKNLNTGVISTDKTGQLVFSNPISINKEINYCPICGSPVKDYIYCSKCGFKIR
ncbi:MAG: PrsW family intramembrane metalloprotease [Bacilli bacterium]|nr:PrsW family intramembrane metalloprotease [Bacilli bacterium]